MIVYAGCFVNLRPINPNDADVLKSRRNDGAIIKHNILRFSLWISALAETQANVNHIFFFNYFSLGARTHILKQCCSLVGNK